MCSVPVIYGCCAKRNSMKYSKMNLDSICQEEGYPLVVFQLNGIIWFANLVGNDEMHLSRSFCFTNETRMKRNGLIYVIFRFHHPLDLLDKIIAISIKNNWK